MTTIKRHPWLAVCALAGSLLASACAAPDAEEGEATEGGDEIQLTDRVTVSSAALSSLGLTYAEASVMEISPSLEVPAELVPVPDRLASIGSRVPGRVARVLVNTGDLVAAGQPLVVLESADVGRAWANLVAARAQEHVALRARDRQQGLLEARVTSGRAYEEAEGALLVAEAEVRAARTRLAAYGIGDTEEPPSDPAVLTLRAPIGGTVTMRSANVGAWVEPADILVEVMDLDELWVEAAVYEQEMRLVGVGQPVQVEVRAFPGVVFRGAVERVEGVLDENTRSVGVRIVLPNAEHRLRPGMFATARIQGTNAHAPRSLVAVPWASVQNVDGHQVVFVRVDEGVFELRSVHTGARAGDFVEILTGLDPGDSVVADGSFLLKGQLLRSTLAEEEG